MKIENGKYYRTRGGLIAGPMNVPPKNNQWPSIVVADCGDRVWFDGGRYLTSGECDKDLIAEWSAPVDLTAITTAFGLLDDETQQALRDHGGPYEVFAVQYDGEYSWGSPQDRHITPLDEEFAWRAKPKQATWKAVLYWSAGEPGTLHRWGSDTHKITITLEGDTPIAISITPLR